MKHVKFLLALHHIALLSAFMVVISVNAQETTTLSLYFPDIEGSTYVAQDVNETFTLDVTVENVIGLYSYQIRLKYDSDVLEVMSNPSKGKFLKNSLLDTASSEEGELFLGSSSLSQNGVDGDGTLVSIIFIIKRPTLHSSIEFIEHFLKDASGNDLGHQVQNSIVSLNSGDIPIAEAGMDIIVDEGEEVILDGSSSTNPTNESLSFIWSFENKILNETDNIIITPVELTGITTSTVFDIPGKYTVSLTVQTDDDLTSKDNVQIQVLDVTSPLAKINLDRIPENITEGDLITFSALDSIDPEGGQIVQYYWDFGNGVEQQTKNLEITTSFEALGTYDVMLTVEDEVGNIASDDVSISVGINLSESGIPSLALNIIVGVTCLVFGGSVFWLRKLVSRTY